MIFGLHILDCGVKFLKIYMENKDMLRYVAMAVLAAGMLTGCVSVKYQGDTYPATGDVKLFENRSLIPENYVSIGKCVAYGRYDSFNKNAICEKVRSRAESVGADAVYIYAYQVIPESVVTGAVERVWDDGTSNTEWSRLERDFASYGQIGKNSTAPYAHDSYMRVIRAEFLKNPVNMPQPLRVVNANLQKVGPDPQIPPKVVPATPVEVKKSAAPAEKAEPEKNKEAAEKPAAK